MFSQKISPYSREALGKRSAHPQFRLLTLEGVRNSLDWDLHFEKGDSQNPVF